MAIQGSLGRRWRAFREWVSFSAEVRQLVEVLNQEIIAPDQLRLRTSSHPGGFVRALTARRISMAEAYLKLSTASGISDHSVRLTALRDLVHSAWHAKTLALPMNTARVQVALMKECVRARGDRSRQLELMQDFAVASYGQESVIRRLLLERGLFETAEDGRKLCEMGLGWDDHVHDSSSLGRRTPSQLVLDAFIKGISRITVAYYDLESPQIMEEAYEAGRMLGVDVEVGIEFSVGRANARHHYMYIPPQDGTLAGLWEFLEKHQASLASFRAGLVENAQARQAGLADLLEEFNRIHLPGINRRYQGIRMLQVPTISWEDVVRTVPEGRISRVQLGYVLAESMRPIMHSRVLYLANQLGHAEYRQRQGGVSEWETEHLRRQLQEAEKDYRECTPHLLQARYAVRGASRDRDSTFLDMGELGPLLAGCGGQVVFIHPLSVGLNNAILLLLANHPWITGVETFNMSDALNRDPADLRRLNRLVSLLNSGDAPAVERILADGGISEFDRGLLLRACQHFSERHLRVSFGSDYIGGHPDVPGMGFVSSTSLEPRTVEALRRSRQPAVPESIAREALLARTQEDTVSPGAQVFFVSRNPTPEDSHQRPAAGQERVSPIRFWRYLNPGVRMWLKAGIAMIPAALTVGPGYGLLWLGITAFRNMMADLIASTGSDLRHWSMGSVDKDNLGNSVFWTGFSVPILAAAKFGFDSGWPILEISSPAVTAFAKFWVIAVSNGLYISLHNRLRGFPSPVIRANFFRTVLSWPLATLGSFLLSPVGIPDIVQSKIWSDVVAGLIEGTGKFVRRLRLRKRDIQEMLDTLATSTGDAATLALVDLLYVWACRDRGRAAMQALLSKCRPKGSPERNPGNTLDGVAQGPVNALDKLAAEFTSEGSIERLSCAVLANFNEREAEVLARIVGEHHDRFVDWLRLLRKEVAGKSGTSAAGSSPQA